MKLIAWYLRVSLVKRVVAGLLLGAASGACLWYASAAFGIKAEVRRLPRRAHRGRDRIV